MIGVVQPVREPLDPRKDLYASTLVNQHRLAPKGYTSVNFVIAVPQSGNEVPLNVELSPGESLFVLGPNGSGKSALLQFLCRAHANAHWVSAQRRTSLEPGGSNLSGQQWEATKSNIKIAERWDTARWKPDFANQRPDVTMLAIFEKQNSCNRQIANDVRGGDTDAAVLYSKENEDPLATLNRLFRNANLAVQLFIGEDHPSEISARRDKAVYSSARLSDGERNALLLLSEVLTAPSGALVLIDEPERHLHRSIVSPLLAGVTSERPDCRFVIATHEVMLPLDFPSPKVLLVRDCVFKGELAMQWTATLANPFLDIGDDLKRELWGARKTILYVEGTDNSVDIALYQALFPKATVYPRGAATEVDNAVQRTRGEHEFTWVDVYGIVDGNGRPSDEKAERARQHVHTLDAYAVESIYYDPVFQRALALIVHENVFGGGLVLVGVFGVGVGCRWGCLVRGWGLLGCCFGFVVGVGAREVGPPDGLWWRL